MSSTPLLEAASSSTMFMDVPELNARHESHSLQASPSGVRCSQLMVLANMRAQEVLPTPREPQNRYECARRFVATAFFSVAVSDFCPTTEANVAGRYFLAETKYFSIIVYGDGVLITNIRRIFVLSPNRNGGFCGKSGCGWFRRVS